MKVQAKEQMQKGAEQMNQIPAEARDCVKQKLGSDIFSILESGDAEKMKNVSQGDIQSAIMSCITKNIPSGGNGMGPSQEQIQEMMKSGRSSEPGTDTGNDSEKYSVGSSSNVGRYAIEYSGSADSGTNPGNDSEKYAVGNTARYDATKRFSNSNIPINTTVHK